MQDAHNSINVNINVKIEIPALSELVLYLRESNDNQVDKAIERLKQATKSVKDSTDKLKSTINFWTGE